MCPISCKFCDYAEKEFIKSLPEKFTGDNCRDNVPDMCKSEHYTSEELTKLCGDKYRLLRDIIRNFTEFNKNHRFSTVIISVETAKKHAVFVGKSKPINPTKRNQTENYSLLKNNLRTSHFRINLT